MHNEFDELTDECMDIDLSPDEIQIRPRNRRDKLNDRMSDVKFHKKMKLHGIPKKSKPKGFKHHRGRDPW